MLVVVLLLVGAAWLSRYLRAQKIAKQDAIVGRPAIKRSELRGTFLSGPARARRLGRRKTGDDGTFASLVAARRFREASRLTRPENHADRARLAVARDAPIVDLKLAARMDPKQVPKDLRPTIIAAQRALKRLYGATNWGYAVSPSIGHMVPASEREVIALLTRGRLRTALAVNRRMLRAFPNADAADSWTLNSALIAAILGRSGTSRKLSVALAAGGASARFGNRAPACLEPWESRCGLFVLGVRNHSKSVPRRHCSTKTRRGPYPRTAWWQRSRKARR